MEIKVGTIRQIHKVLLANGYQVSENALRQWVRCGRVPAAYSGHTAYISYEKVIEYLLNQQAIPA